MAYLFTAEHRIAVERQFELEKFLGSPCIVQCGRDRSPWNYIVFKKELSKDERSVLSSYGLEMDRMLEQKAGQRAYEVVFAKTKLEALRLRSVDRAMRMVEG
jgi:hypothetical protein